MDTEVQEETKKNRRIKSIVKKKKKQKRKLEEKDRSAIIEYLNATQDVMIRDQGEGDGECKRLCDAINAMDPKKEPLAEYQVAGFFGFLTRTALKSKRDIESWWAGAVKSGKVLASPVPVFSPQFISKISVTQLRDQEDADRRAIEHQRIKAERAAKENSIN